MSPRTARVLLVMAAFLAGLASVLTVMLLVVGRGGPTITTQASAVGGPFKLVNQDGQTVTEQDYKGKPTLVFFGFTHCPDVCPTTLFEVSEVLRALGPEADEVQAAFITVDPERDTPEKLKDYLSSFDPHLTALTGDAEAVAAVAKAYKVYWKKVPTEGGNYTMDHTAIVYLMDKDGKFVAPFSVKRKPQDAAADLKKYL
jgi:protein SCO1/2